jgi:hypothetical protein
MDRATDGVDTVKREHDSPAFARRDIAGIRRKLRRIDEGVVNEFLVIGEVNDAALADHQTRRGKHATGLTHLEVGADSGTGRKAQDDDNRQIAHGLVFLSAEFTIKASPKRGFRQDAS